MKNAEIRTIIKINRLFYYEVASQLGVSEYTLSRWLREELDEEKRQRVLKAIADLKTELWAEN